MSRRVTAFALAACAALCAAPAAADRECYDQSCRMPDVVDPPKVTETPAPTETTGLVDAVPPPIEERAPAPTRVRPQMVVDPARYQHEPRYSVDAGPYRRMQPAPRYVEEQGPVRVVNQGPTYSGRAHAPAYVVNQGPTYGGPGIVAVAAPVYQEQGVVIVPAYPYLRPDPAWQLCQMDHRARRQHALCGPYSYHPYGTNGYRPYGTYGGQHSAAAVVYTAPDARIINIEADD